MALAHYEHANPASAFPGNERLHHACVTGSESEVRTDSSGLSDHFDHLFQKKLKAVPAALIKIEEA